MTAVVPRLNRRWSYSVTVAPTQYPVKVAELADYLKVDLEDDLLAGFIVAATAQLENNTRRRFLNTTIAEVYDDWPFDEGYHGILHWNPVSSISSITYLDTNGDSQTLASTNYRLDSTTEPARILLDPDGDVPQLEPEAANRVTITYVAGYGATAASTPALAKHAIKLWAAQAYCSRGFAPIDLSVWHAIIGPLLYTP